MTECCPLGNAYPCHVLVLRQALAISKETFIRINSEGLMSIQHQVSDEWWKLCVCSRSVCPVLPLCIHLSSSPLLSVCLSVCVHVSVLHFIFIFF